MPQKHIFYSFKIKFHKWKSVPRISSDVVVGTMCLQGPCLHSIAAQLAFDGVSNMPEQPV